MHDARPFSIRSLSLLLAAGALTGCGGGGSDGSSSTASGVVTTETAYFVDAPVEGLHYDAGSGVTGTTDALGRFRFVPGQQVVFSVGSIEIGRYTPASGKRRVTPCDLAGVDARACGTDTTATTIAALLQTIDANDGDGNVSQGSLKIPATLSFSGTTLADLYSAYCAVGSGATCITTSSAGSTMSGELAKDFSNSSLFAPLYARLSASPPMNGGSAFFFHTEADGGTPENGVAVLLDQGAFLTKPRYLSFVAGEHNACVSSLTGSCTSATPGNHQADEFSWDVSANGHLQLTSTSTSTTIDHTLLGESVSNPATAEGRLVASYTDGTQSGVLTITTPLQAANIADYAGSFSTAFGAITLGSSTSTASLGLPTQYLDGTAISGWFSARINSTTENAVWYPGVVITDTAGNISGMVSVPGVIAIAEYSGTTVTSIMHIMFYDDGSLGASACASSGTALNLGSYSGCSLKFITAVTAIGSGVDYLERVSVDTATF